MNSLDPFGMLHGLLVEPHYKEMPFFTIGQVEGTLEGAPQSSIVFKFVTELK